MNRWIFSDNSVKELARLSKQLYETFTKANRQLVSDSKRTIGSDFYLDYALDPSRFHYLAYKEKQLSLFKLRNGKFTLECYGFKPSQFECLGKNSEYELYRHFYGVFPTVEEALKAFRSCSYQIMGVD